MGEEGLKVFRILLIGKSKQVVVSRIICQTLKSLANHEVLADLMMPQCRLPTCG